MKNKSTQKKKSEIQERAEMNVEVTEKDLEEELQHKEKIETKEGEEEAEIRDDLYNAEE